MFLQHHQCQNKTFNLMDSVQRQIQASYTGTCLTWAFKRLLMRESQTADAPSSDPLASS